MKYFIFFIYTPLQVIYINESPFFPMGPTSLLRKYAI